MAKVELKGIGKVYDGGVRAVNNANITIEYAEFLVFNSDISIVYSTNTAVVNFTNTFKFYLCHLIGLLKGYIISIIITYSRQKATENFLICMTQRISLFV